MNAFLVPPIAMAIALPSFLASAAQGTPTAIQPVARTDANSRLAHEQLLAKAKTGRIDVYFVGDSITRRWGTTDPQYRELLAHWTTNFYGWNAANFGWGADKIENILWRLENGELEGVHPKVIVVLAGTNDVGTAPGDEAKAARIAAGIKSIIDACHLRAPHATVIAMALFPRNDKLELLPLIREVNRRVALWADGKSIRFLDINPKLADEKGIFFEGMANPDQLHPTIQAYQAWADALRPILMEILGPPAPIDRAPPPTGDPSVSKPNTTN